MTKVSFFKSCVALVVFAAGSSFAQMTPVGTWHSIDDKTGEAKAEIQIADKDGALSGRVVKSRCRHVGVPGRDFSSLLQ